MTLFVVKSIFILINGQGYESINMQHHGQLAWPQHSLELSYDKWVYRLPFPLPFDTLLTVFSHICSKGPGESNNHLVAPIVEDNLQTLDSMATGRIVGLGCQKKVAIINLVNTGEQPVVKNIMINHSSAITKFHAINSWLYWNKSKKHNHSIWKYTKWWSQK